ncbi:ATP-dependent zinc metalloprotease FtsH [Nocardioides sp.]|uniref:ATP-dependent zinc metalloprotease FtsH n=1 Tax=Nocardioides sp. TaxID=35761 RepID=UPI0035693A07
MIDTLEKQAASSVDAQAQERLVLRPRQPGWTLRGLEAARLGLASLSPRAWLLGALVALFALFLGSLLHLGADTEGRELSLDQLAELARAGDVERATFLDQDARIAGRLAPGDETFWVAYPASDSATGVLLHQLTEAGAEVSVDGQPDKAAVRVIATGLLPLMILAALFGLFFVGGAGSRGSDIKSFGTLGKRNRGRATPPEVKFDDVAGADEAVAELREVVEYLHDPAKYARLGASPPKGVLLFGPPGTGKTLIARATAGEAGVPFFSVAGAEFVESLVGVGAARIRDLFAAVREVAPAIVFIDELDAAGRRRGGADSGGSEEREQTLNQLLVELDGFAASSGVVVMGATNRPDILDPALLRPGRFDRHVTVDEPDISGRHRILELHSRNKPLAAEVDLLQIARRTPGFTGADLANVVNEAALLAIREGRANVAMGEFVEAIERVLGGPRRRGRILSEDMRRRIATHEAGHAIVATVVGEDVHRVSVVARGSGLGAVALGGAEDAALMTSDQLFSRLVATVSGPCAEELAFGTPSTGSEGDLHRATTLARDMVVRYGMSDEVGRVRLVGSASDTYLGGEASTGELSDELRRRVETATSRLIQEAFDRATAVLEAHRRLLEEMVSCLIVEEALEGVALERYLGRLSPGR